MVADSTNEHTQLSPAEMRQLRQQARQLVDAIFRVQRLNSEKFGSHVRRAIESRLRDADRLMWDEGDKKSPISVKDLDILQERVDQTRSLLFRLSVEFEELFYSLDPGQKLHSAGDAKNFKKELTTTVSLVIRLQSKIIQIRDRYNLLPPDLPAPIRVAVLDDKLVRVSPKQTIGAIPTTSLKKLRTSAAEMLEKVIQLVEGSDNLDKRLATVLTPLHNQLTNEYENDFSVEALGDNWRLLQQLRHRMESELPAVVLALIDRCLDSIETILLQFSEWHTYLNSEKTFHVPPQHIDEVIEAAREIAAKFEKHPEIVDQAVVAGLRAIIEPATSGLVRSESIIAPLVASLSNIFSALSAAVIDAAPTLIVSVEKLGSGPRYAIIVLALAAMNYYGIKLENIPALAFVRKAHDYVGKQFPYLKDILR